MFGFNWHNFYSSTSTQTTSGVPLLILMLMCGPLLNKCYFRHLILVLEIQSVEICPQRWMLRLQLPPVCLVQDIKSSRLTPLHSSSQSLELQTLCYLEWLWLILTSDILYQALLLHWKEQQVFLRWMWKKGQVPIPRVATRRSQHFFLCCCQSS